MTTTCDNCGADVLPGHGGRASDGRRLCCAACAFHPLGCRCWVGEPGVAETVDYGLPDDEAD